MPVAYVVHAPHWAWLGVGEVPSSSAVVGGSFIVAAVILVVTRRQRALPAPRVADS